MQGCWYVPSGGLFLNILKKRPIAAWVGGGRWIQEKKKDAVVAWWKEARMKRTSRVVKMWTGETFCLFFLPSCHVTIANLPHQGQGGSDRILLGFYHLKSVSTDNIHGTLLTSSLFRVHSNCVNGGVHPFTRPAWFLLLDG
jgi:hypothetical protein